MKEKLIALDVYGNEVAKHCNTHPLYEVLSVFVSLYEDIVAPFKLTLEQVMYVCLMILERVRNGGYQSLEESDALFHHLVDVYEQMPKPPCTKQSIAFAALVSLRSAYFCLQTMDSAFGSFYEKSISCLQGTIDHYGDSYGNKRGQLEFLFQKDLLCERELLWNLNFLPFLKEFMEGKEHILDEMEMIIAKRMRSKVNDDEDEVVALKKQVKKLEAHVKSLKEELEVAEVAEVKGAKQFRIRHIVILFEALLGKTAIASEMTVSDFALLLSMVSGYGSNSIDNKIPASGLDYMNPRVRKQANEVIKYLENLSPEMAERIRKKLNG